MPQEQPTFSSQPSWAGIFSRIPMAARLILLKGIYSFEPARTLVAGLAGIGVHKSERTVMVWLKCMRVWLAFPEHYPCVSNSGYRNLVLECLARNGVPTLEDLMSGWTPENSPALFAAQRK